MSRAGRTAAGLGAVLLAAVLLHFSLRGIEWRVVAGTIASIHPGYASPAIVIGILPMFLRAARWRILLEAKAPVAYQTTFWAVAAGYFGNNFLPARGGEFVRSYIVQARSALSVSYVLATALSERVADAVALVILGAFVLPGWLAGWRVSLAAVGFTGVATLACLPALEKPLGGVLVRVPRMRSIIQQVLQGVGSLHDGKRLAGFAALTLAIWMLDAVATSTLAYSLSITMPLSVAMLLIVALSLSSAFPLTPGYVGVYQLVAVTVLKPFGIPVSAAIAFILVAQAQSYAVTGILGLLAVTRYTPITLPLSRKSNREQGFCSVNN